MANAYVRMRHPDYDVLRGMLDDVGRTVHVLRLMIDRAARAAARGPPCAPPCAASTGPVATVTAGWQEREADDAELDALLGGRSRQPAALRPLAGRAGARPRVRRGRTRAPRRGWRAAASSTWCSSTAVLGALREVARRGGSRPAVRDAVRADARDGGPAPRRAAPGQGRPRRARRSRRRGGPRSGCRREHREEVGRVARRVRRRSAIAGGHVGVLVHVLRLFARGAASRPTRRRRLVGGGDGAHRAGGALPRPRPARAVRTPSSLDVGLGVGARGGAAAARAAPAARRRPRADVGAGRAGFAPARCVVLDDGVRLDLGPDGALPPDARVRRPRRARSVVRGRRRRNSVVRARAPSAT